MILIPSNFMMLSTMILSALMAISSSNWLMIWASLELNMFSFIPIMMFSNMIQETEATVKYFLSQALGSAVMLVSSIIMWNNSTITVAPMILIMSLMIKLGAAPCHFWFPSVMSSISWMNCFILGTWQKLAPLILICYPAMSPSSPLTMTVIGPMNAIIGGISGLNQTKLRAIMAYSSITHMGWMLSALIMYMPAMSITYFMTYILLSSPLFLIMLIYNINTAMDLNSMFSKSMIMAPTLALLLMSLGGLPPLSGFLPKWMMISFMSMNNKAIIIMLIMGSILNLFFYLNISFNLLTSMQSYTPHYNQNQLLNKTLMSMIALSSLGILLILT